MARNEEVWTLEVDGTYEDASDNKITVIRHTPQPLLHLEIDAPGVLSGPGELDDRVRAKVQETLDALQAALDSPSGLPLRRFPKP